MDRIIHLLSHSEHENMFAFERTTKKINTISIILNSVSVPDMFWKNNS
ncbi:MAG: hypothetical protein ACKESC_00785 [Candidatus Hodgkinia cicadicola]